MLLFLPISTFACNGRLKTTVNIF